MVSLYLGAAVVALTFPLHVASLEEQDAGPLFKKAQHKTTITTSLRSLQTSLTDGPGDNNNNANNLESICAAVQDAFAPAEVHCECFGSITSFLSISCEYQSSICSDTTCGRPLLGVSMVDGNLFSSTTCIRDYVRQQKQVLGETCVSVTACDDDSQADNNDGAAATLCECIASYQSDICRSCEICQGGKGISFDCTNVNAEAISSPCHDIDMDLDLQGAGALGGFIPEMSGLCTGLEKALDNRISCDCTKASGGSYSISCETNDDDDNDDNDNKEQEDNTKEQKKPKVQSSVDIVEGAVASVTACSGDTCTFLQFCPDDKDRICGCVALYDGQACDFCQVCEGGQAVKMDCSNVNPQAKLNKCQDVSSTYEFIPQFPMMDDSAKNAEEGNERPGSSSDNNMGEQASKTSSGTRSTVQITIGVLSALLVVYA